MNADNYQLFIVSRSGSGHVLRFDAICGFLSKHPDLEVWTPLRDIKEFACVSYRQFVYILGGYNIRSKKPIQTVKRYDTSTKTWLDLPSMDGERRLCTAVVLNNEIIVCGGFTGANKLHTTTEIFNLSRNSWRKGPRLRKGVCDMQMIALNGSVFGFGGMKSSNFNKELIFCGNDEILEYNEYSREWLFMDDNVPLVLGKPVYNHSIVEVESKIYIIGGLKTVLNHNDMISKVINTQVESLCMNNNQLNCLNKNNLKDWISPWDRSLPSPNISRYGAATVALGTDIYLFGGISECQPNGVFEVEKFNTKHCCWNTDFVIKQEVDLTMVSALKVTGSDNENNPIILNDPSYNENATITNEYAFESEMETELSVEPDIVQENETQMYKVGWVLW